MPRRRRTNKSFIGCLQQKLGKVETIIWIKKNLEAKTCEIMFTDHKNNTCFERIQDWVTDFIE